MPSIKLRNFKGMYSNIDESDADQEFLRICKDVKIRPGQMSSQSYRFEEIEGLVNADEEVLHFEVVYIDNDKNANQLSNDGKLISAYKRDLQTYYLLVVYNKETRIKLFRDKMLVYTTPSLGLPKFDDIKIVNDDGTVRIIANDTIYLLSKISRLRYPQLTQKVKVEILEISLDLMPTQIATVALHQLSTGDTIEIHDWEGTYGRVCGSSLNGVWKVTVINSQKFTVDNHITSSTKNGYFEIVESKDMVYNSGFNFEELIPKISSLKVTIPPPITSGFLLNDPVKVEFLGTNKVLRTDDYKTFIRDDTDEEIKRTLPCWEFQFSVRNIDGSLTGINLSEIPKLSLVEWWPDKEGIKLGKMVFPLSAEYNYSGDRGLIVRQEFFTKYFDMKSSGAEYINDPKVITTDDGKWIELSGDYYLVDPQALALPNNLVYKGNQSIKEVGFFNTTSKAFIIGTCIYDYNDEAVFFTKDFSISLTHQRFGLNIVVDTQAITNLSKRITAIAFYMKTVLADDYQQIKYIDLCSGVSPGFDFFVSSLNPNGIYLNQTIGVMYDTDRYELIRSVQDYKVISGIPFIISDGSLVAGAIGSGNAMNIFYEQNIVPDVSDLNLTQIVDVNGTLGAADESSLNLITVTNTDGVLLFSKKDSLSYGISDSNHIVELPEGTVIYTKQGIFITNGYDKKLISEQINNIVEDNYDNGYITYDSLNEELYFSDGKQLYKYSSLYNYWVQIGITPNGILRVSDSGELIFFAKTKIDKENINPPYEINYVYACYRMVESINSIGHIKTMNMDLGDPTMVKSFKSIAFDFEGTLWFDEIVEGKVKRWTFESDGRSMILKNFRVNSRNSIRFGFEGWFTGTLYGLTLNYEAQGEARLRTYSNI